ncbi:TIGR03087 family PEP-CTERM/XrtA system glycosyltransferase [uncultured Sphingomonas sp.]|uniref:TIGR03087 family PEP-CTERM/XrtA system glycosyltransferase n=1 Tax=uncultured Sphingomonas sp. TaxID=158754 RepID=UPI0035CC57E0
MGERAGADPAELAPRPTVLFLAHRAPFPPDRGDKIRGWHVLHYLAARARVHLVAFADDPRDLTPPPELAARLASCTIVPRGRTRPLGVLRALATGRPLSLVAFADRRIAAAVARIGPMDAAYVFSGQMAQYLPLAADRTIMDFVDRDSAKFAAYGESGRPPLRWVYAREGRRLAAFEAAVAARVDVSLFVSAAEAAMLPGGQVLENGIDSAFFDPAGVVPIAGAGPLIVFTGQMDYRPNIEAVRWFAADVLPLIRAAHPAVRFAIVGRAPVPAVRALAGEGVLVTGEVADVRPWLAGAAVVVAPLLTARGVQNKVLEAMAMARPVVATGAAAEGIDHAGTIDVAGGAAAFATAVGKAIARGGDRPEARAQVMRRYGWDARLAPLDALVGLPALEAVAA